MTSLKDQLGRLLSRVGMQPDDSQIVNVETKWWCTVPMVVFGCLMCLVETAFLTADADKQGGLGAIYGVLSMLLAFVVGFVFLARSKYPEYVFAIACLLVLVCPFDSIISTMALSSLLARRSERKRSTGAIIIAAAIAVFAQARDTFQPLKNSVWATLFAKPRVDTKHDPIVLASSVTTMRVTAIIAGLVSVLIATLIGLHIRSRANLKTETLKANAAQTQADNLQTSLSNQQLSDAIAAEAHDTLAHTLSLIALNANALTIQTGKLAKLARSTPQTDGDNTLDSLSELIERTNRESEQIRSQAAQAVDEAHTVIDMLRDPQAAVTALAASDETSLSRATLQELLDSSTDSGTRLSTWIDINQLSELNESIGKVAYRAIQEGLTNARKHAPGAPVSLEVSARPKAGILVHLINPVPAGAQGQTQAKAGQPGQTGQPSQPGQPGQPSHGGAGLTGLTERVRGAGGNCAYGFDQRGQFNLEVSLPWIAK
ncbi:sensor histidine kinase [Bifidobacterium sp. ESL0790]|uniref:sensor histidine kinase n=1 Tax=Bifidobacterium sp. ESL0790 TaxID=2983233 RepID=UPI0023F63741|nr:sensor histidine kinase [Bifidobacterium sp. ESL0790]WEV72914.1 sensor histidine kinase [Bifidobacterium sp. ESL0790]